VTLKLNVLKKSQKVLAANFSFAIIFLGRSAAILQSKVKNKARRELTEQNKFAVFVQFHN